MAVSLDSQPYHGGGLIAVTSVTSVEQEITSPGSASYTFVRCLLAVDPTETSTLTLNLRKRSDDSLVSSVSFTPAQVLAAEIVGVQSFSPTQMLDVHLLEVPMTAAALTAVQYYFEWTSPSGSLWYLMALGTGDTSPGSFPSDPDATENGNVATFGGTTDTLLSGGPPPVVAYDSIDAPVTISTQPSAPTGLAASLGYQEPASASDIFDCLPDQVDFITVTWTPTSLAADFAYYRIDRSTDNGTTWQQVAQISTEGVNTYEDFEAPIGVEILYRIAVIRAGDLIPSPWANSVEILRYGAGECVWVLASNEEPSLTVAYTDNGNNNPTRKFGFQDADTAQYRQLWGRTYSVRSQPDTATNYRGDRFDLDLIIGCTESGVADSEGGRAMFDPLLDLVLSGVSQIAVMDWRGRVWYAGVECPEGSIRELAGTYEATVQVTEIAPSPAVLDVELTGEMVLRDATWWVDANEASEGS